LVVFAVQAFHAGTKMEAIVMTKGRYSHLFLIFLFLTLSLGFAASVGQSTKEPAKPEPANWSRDYAQGWNNFEQLRKEQKYQAASSLVEKMLADARAKKDNTEWTRCLIRYTQVRIALHGYETSVRFLKDQPWPDDLTGSSVLNLYYARSLVTYARSYSYEINRREKVDTKGVVDLKAWTRDQIYEEAQKAFEYVWKNRTRLGELPNTEWKEYLAPNNYPAGIRPTLRDAVSYLRAEMLDNTNSWSPDQLNDIHRLDIKKLTGNTIGEVSLVDPAVHPLEKICFILSDLENWHAQKAQREAALESRFERYRYLHRHFTETEDRKFIQSEMENYLKPLAAVPWYARGMAQLAEFVMSGNEPDSLLRAREIAFRGEKAHPESIGGKRCHTIIKGIEAPEYSLSGMQNDNPNKKSLLATYKNLEMLYFRVYSFDLLRTFAVSNDYSLLPSGRDLENLVLDNKPIYQWETPLPATPNYRMHKKFIIPPMTKPGVYCIVASARPGFPKEDNRLSGLYMAVGDLALVTRMESATIETTVLSGLTGKPVVGAEVIRYERNFINGHTQKDSKLSDQRGIVQFKYSQSYGYFLVARSGDQITFDPRGFEYYPEPPPEPLTATLIFTDRSVYRPQQKISWKAILYKGSRNGIRFEASPDSKLTISLRDLNHQVVESKTVTTNSFGTASGEFVIPSGRALGQWFLESSKEGGSIVRVEEYKRPTFEAKMLDPKEPLRLNQKANLKGEAKYYFGLPVSSGQVKWVVRREPVFPWWWGYCWFGGDYSFRSSSVQVVASGTSALKEDGTFTINFLPEADERLGKNKEITYRYSVTADVTDEGGETRSAKRAFRVGFVSVEASASTEKTFFAEDAPIKISVLRSNLDGISRPGKGTWRIVALKGPGETLLPAEQPLFIPKEVKTKDEYQKADDLQRERWSHSYNPEVVMLQWEDGAPQEAGAISHDEKGKAEITVRHLPPGAYRLIYETVDDFGAKSEMKKDFIVAASSMKLPLPAMLNVENPSAKVGDTVKVLAHSGLKDQLMIFEIYRAGKRIRRKEMLSGKDPSVIEIPITEEDRGGLSISLALLRDNQFVQLHSSLFIPWDNKELKVEFSTFRDRLKPGNTETWSVKVSGAAGKNVAAPAAELLAYMYDRSLDAFVPHSPADPLSLYPHRDQLVPAQSNLTAAPPLWLQSKGFNRESYRSDLKKDRLVFYSGYGIGGVGSARFASLLEMESQLEEAGGYEDELGYFYKQNYFVNQKAEKVAFAPGDGAGIGAGLAYSYLTAGDVSKAKAAAEIPVDDKELRYFGTLGKLPARSERAGSAPIELRSDFSETAFWQPHLLTGPDGSVSFEFKVPDSVTSWNVWVHAITKDFQSGSVKREAQSVKELMVRPYLPRFLREGDQADINVVVNNASDHELKGSLNFDIIDTATDQSILSEFGLSKSNASGKSFAVAKSGGTNLTFPIKTPSRVGQIAFKVTATSGDFSDGELRPIPILPGRMHLMQSRFVTLKDKSQRVMRFDDLARNNDPTRINEQMVVTLDAQLFYSVLSALPYLVNYPYECTEQTLNRFVSTGILSSLYQQYPAVEHMAKEFSSRKTQFEQWDAPDPNRKMALEETPWLQMAKGGSRDADELINVLDSRIAKAQRESALASLRKMQTSSGGFPWFPGGPPSPYMTLYLLNGFSKALEFKVEVPREMVLPAWSYMHRHYLDDIVRDMRAHDSGWEFVTFINYVLSNYPDSTWYQGAFTPEERKTMLDFSFKHWKSHSPYLKGYLALTLNRMDRPKDALLVWQSVMDSAKTAEDQGTFWVPEDRAWLWYNDTIETHAFAIRTDMELSPKDPKIDGMVLWLFLNKKLNHWKSTRATAEVIYSLAHYLKKTELLAIREDAAVSIGNQKTSFVFEPDKYTGKKNQIVIPGEKIDPNSSITVEKTSKGHLFASATWHFSTEQLPEEDRGDYLKLSRSYFKRVNKGKEYVLQPLQEAGTIALGDEVEVHLSLTSKHPMEYVHLRDPRAAGFEPSSNISKHKRDMGIFWYEEIRDSGTNFFFERLPQGEYAFKYRMRAATAGSFKVAPATVQPMYAPEFAAYSSGASINNLRAIDHSIAAPKRRNTLLVIALVLIAFGIAVGIGFYRKKGLNR
jgi:alpha-2-macroglobulin